MKQQVPNKMRVSLCPYFGQGDDLRMHCLVVDDEWLPRGGTVRAVEAAKPDARVTEAASLQEAFAALESVRDIDLVLLDLNLGGTAGLSTLSSMRSWCEANDILPRIVVLSGAAEQQPELLLQVLEGSGTGFLEKSMPPRLFQAALLYTLNGGIFIPPRALEQLRQRTSPPPAASKPRQVALTPREEDVVRCLIHGFTYKRIAMELTRRGGTQIEEATVRTHVNNMAWKLGVPDGIKPKAGVLAAIASRGLTFPDD
jgi:DNA-binding NarL/FixJ family response regulator